MDIHKGLLKKITLAGFTVFVCGIMGKNTAVKVTSHIKTRKLEELK